MPDYDRYFGGDMRDALYHSMQVDRTKLKENYNEWRNHPFTKQFLEYLYEAAEQEKECVFSDSITDDARLRTIVRHKIFREVLASPDIVYNRIDSGIESHYRQRESEEQKIDRDKAFADGTQPQDSPSEGNPLL